jgi:beta-glucosidase
MTTRFPDGFLWGAASAPHQVEGGNVTAAWPTASSRW